MIEFLWSWVFLLLPLPLLVHYLLPAVEKTRQAALRVPFLNDFSQQDARTITAQQRWPHLFAGIVWLLLLLATAQPQWVGEPLQLPTSGRDLMLAIDLSGSMKEQDFVLNGRAVDRLTASKNVANDFIQRRQGDRIGLILFGDKAYLQTPLTFDRDTVMTLLQEAVLGLAGERTAIGDAIGLAVKRLQNTDNQDKVLILMTDGANTVGAVDPLIAAELAAEAGLKIYTIGIGADEILRRSFFGMMQRINPSSDLDEETLTGIAETTGGRYFRATDIQELQQIYALLDELEPIEQNAQYFRPTRALFYWPLSAALIITFSLLSWQLLRRQL